MTQIQIIHNTEELLTSGTVAISSINPALAIHEHNDDASDTIIPTESKTAILKTAHFCK